MISLGLLAVVVVLVLLVVMGRRSDQQGTGPPAADHQAATGDLRRWVAAGLVTEAQAEAIGAFEAERRVARVRPRVSAAVEALSYVGGALLAVGAGMLVGQFWDDLGVVGHLGVVSAGALATGTVGAMVGEADPVAWRLRGFLWALSAVGIGAAAGLFVFEVVDATGEPVAVAVAASAASASAGYWWLRDRPLQHLLTFAGLAVSIGVAIEWAAGSFIGGAIGAALWLVGAAWAVSAWRRLLPPASVGIVLGAVLTLVASAFVVAQVEWLAPILGLVTATAWVGVGVWRIGPAGLAPGVAGVFAFLPWTLGYFFGGTLGAPAIAMVSGALLLGVVVLLVRRGRGLGGTSRMGPAPPALGAGAA